MGIPQGAQIEVRTHDAAEERDRARMRHKCRWLVVGVSAGPREGVIDTRIDMDLDVLVAGEGGPNLLAGRFGHELVVGGEMQHQRAFYLRHEVQRFFDPDTVVADRAVDPDMGGGKIGERSAETKAECAGLADAFGARLQRRHARGDVLDRFGDIELLIEAEGLIELGFVEFDTGFKPPKKVRCDDDVPFLGIIVRDIAHIFIDAEDLL